MNIRVGVENYWTFECVAPDGTVKWREEYANLVVTAGLNKLLDATFKTGLTTPAWYVGLVNASGTQTYDAADTMGTHAGWVETTAFAAATRPAFVTGAIAAGSVDNSAAKASFVMNASGSLAGGFLSDSPTKGGTTGTLYAVGNFTGGDRSFASADTVNVTVTLTAAQLV